MNPETREPMGKHGRRYFLRLAGLSALVMGWSSSSLAQGASSARRILIVGGGISGLAASERLRAAGFSTVILEARNRLGGRVWTDANGFDLGASWIHGRKGNPLMALVQGSKAGTFAFDYENQWRYSASGEVDDAASASIDRDFENLQKIIVRAQGKASPATALSTVVDAELSKMDGFRRVGLRYAVNSQIVHEYAADPNALSLRFYDEGSEQAGGDLLIPGGYRQLLGALGTPEDVRLDHVVKKIAWEGQQVTVETSQGPITGEAAIVTLPLGVLQSGKVAFAPELPSGHRQAIGRLGFGTLNKLFLRFPRIAWPKEPHLFGFVGDGWWEEWVNFAPVNGQPVLLGFNAGAIGKQAEKLSDRDLAESAMRVLRSMFGKSLPAPTQVVATRWASDPFAGGSYSSYAPGSSPQDRRTLVSPVSPRLIFAGEACSLDHPATVHGALSSGRQAAESLIQQLRAS